MPTDDFLKECMAQFGPGPIDEFNRIWCVRCCNRQCSRSAANALQFDQRVATWKDRMFLKVPRADEGDPRFDHVRAKRFLPLEGDSGGSMNVISPPRFEVMSPDPDPVPLAPAPVPPPPEDVKVVAPAAPAPAARQPVPDNTPFRQGSFLPQKEGETVMKPGDTFTFGSDE